MASIAERVKDRKKSKKATEENEKNKWIKILDGTIGHRTLVHEFMDSASKVQMQHTTKEMNEKFIDLYEDDGILDDGQFKKLWNENGVQDYYYCLPKWSASHDGMIMFIIPKKLATGYKETNRFFYKNDNEDNPWWKKIGMTNRIKFNGEEYLIYDFPYTIPELDGDPIDFEQENGNGGSHTTNMLWERRQHMVQGPPNEGEDYNTLYTEAYMEEMKDWFYRIFYNEGINKVLLGNDQSYWATFKANLKKIYNCSSRNTRNNNYCTISGGKKRKRRRTVPVYGGRKTRRRRRKKGTKRRRKKGGHAGNASLPNRQPSYTELAAMKTADPHKVYYLYIINTNSDPPLVAPVHSAGFIHEFKLNTNGDKIAITGHKINHHNQLAAYTIPNPAYHTTNDPTAAEVANFFYNPGQGVRREFREDLTDMMGNLQMGGSGIKNTIEGNSCDFLPHHKLCKGGGRKKRRKSRGKSRRCMRRKRKRKTRRKR